jgi:addiction module HigA family antidote
MATKINEYIPSVVFHPGETLAEKLEEIGMGPKEFAVRTNKPEKTIHAVLKGTSNITPEMAVLFEQVLKIPAHFWLNRQLSFDEWQAREELSVKLEAAQTWAKAFPYSDMVKNGWIAAQSTIAHKAKELFAFFNVSNQQAWEEIYYNQQLKVAFRISLAHTKEPHALSAWLRKGELQATELPSTPYNEKDFKEILPDLKKIMANHPKNFFSLLQEICLHVGVKVVHTPCINKAPISGCTRWVKENPLIQLSGRYKRNDSFWFTFFHEVGHILLHGKKDIFLEDIDYSEKDLVKENEADQFAVKWTLSEEEEDIIMQNTFLTEDEIIAYAEQFETHPAIIIGRLQRKKVIPYSIGRNFIEPIQFD